MGVDFHTDEAPAPSVYFYLPMFLDLIIAVAAGILCGVITGITPGIHINLVATTLVAVAPRIAISPLILCVFIIAMSVTHTFLDTLPSIFLGAPDSATALGVLPGHRYLLRGMGLMAVKLTIIGSFGALLLSTLLFPVFIPVVKYGYPFIAKIMFWLILAVVIFMILNDHKRWWALVVFTLAGILGVIVTHANIKEPLLPLLSGLFGVSTLLVSLRENNTLPEQKQSTEIKLRGAIALKALVSGQCSGFITAIMPGLGASTAAVMSMQFTRKLGDHGFMILMGAIGTANFVLSLVALFVMNKARNGSIVAVQTLFPETLTSQVLLLFLATTLIAGGMGVIISLKLGKIFSKCITLVRYDKLVSTIILFIVFLTFVLSGWPGLLVLAVSTAVGIIPAVVKTARTHAMACLLVPVMIFFWPW